MPQADANDASLRCYRCGESLAALGLPFRRLELCPACGVELHVCRMCRHYAPTLPDGCDEDDAIVVRDKTGANFCDYYKPDPGAFDGYEQRAELAARQRLNALFGDAPPSDEPPEPATDSALNAAEKLFRK